MNKKRSRFCDEWMIDFNATKAAQRAGYSKRTAYSQGARLLKDVEIRKELQRRMDEYTMEASEVLSRLGQMAKGEIPTKTVIKGKKVTVHYNEESALEKVGKIHAMFIEKHITLFDDLEIIDDDE